MPRTPTVAKAFYLLPIVAAFVFPGTKAAQAASGTWNGTTDATWVTNTN